MHNSVIGRRIGHAAIAVCSLLAVAYLCALWTALVGALSAGDEVRAALAAATPFAAIGFVGIAIGVGVATIELLGVGWEHSSLRRLLDRSPSSRSDFVYGVASFTGAQGMAATAFSLGAGLWVHRGLEALVGAP